MILVTGPDLDLCTSDKIRQKGVVQLSQLSFKNFLLYRTNLKWLLFDSVEELKKKTTRFNIKNEYFLLTQKPIKLILQAIYFVNKYNKL